MKEQNQSPERAAAAEQAAGVLLESAVVAGFTVRRLRAVAPHEHRAVEIRVNLEPGQQAGAILHRIIAAADFLSDEDPVDAETLEQANKVFLAHYRAPAKPLASEETRAREEQARQEAISRVAAECWRCPTIEEATQIINMVTKRAALRGEHLDFLDSLNGHISET